MRLKFAFKTFSRPLTAPVFALSGAVQSIWATLMLYLYGVVTFVEAAAPIPILSSVITLNMGDDCWFATGM